MTRYRLDTNVLVRFLTHDDPAQSPRADALFERAARGECVLLLSEGVLIETVWVLGSVYGQARGPLADGLSRLLVKPGIRCPDLDVTLDALDRFKRTNLDVVDCHVAAQAAAEGDDVATFDAGFRKFGDVRLWDPEAE